MAGPPQGDGVQPWSDNNCAAAFSLASAVCSIFICAFELARRAIIATIVSTGLTFEPSSAPVLQLRAVASAEQVAAVAARNRPSVPRFSGTAAGVTSFSLPTGWIGGALLADAWR